MFETIKAENSPNTVKAINWQVPKIVPEHQAAQIGARSSTVAWLPAQNHRRKLNVQFLNSWNGNLQASAVLLYWNSIQHLWKKNLILSLYKSPQNKRDGDTFQLIFTNQNYFPLSIPDKDSTAVCERGEGRQERERQRETRPISLMNINIKSLTNISK